MKLGDVIVVLVAIFVVIITIAAAFNIYAISNY